MEQIPECHADILEPGHRPGLFSFRRALNEHAQIQQSTGAFLRFSPLRLVRPSAFRDPRPPC